MEQLNKRHFRWVESDQIALLHIRASQQSCGALRQAARRIRLNIREDDVIFLLAADCLIVLSATTFAGAQIVARRIYSLLVDVEFELEVLCDKAAHALLQKLQREHTLSVVEAKEPTARIAVPEVQQGPDKDGLPYLAFLASYPSHRLLHIFPYELACRYQCVPVGAERGVLTLATCCRLDQELIIQLRKVIQRDIFQVRCEASMVHDILNYWHSGSTSQEQNGR